MIAQADAVVESRRHLAKHSTVIPAKACIQWGGDVH